MNTIFNINDYLHLFDGNDCTPAVIAAINDAKQNGGTVLFEKGEYHFYEKNTENVSLLPMEV